MRLERVIARAFGPFRDEVLDFAPGLTVVSGPNESGKTSWHAATRAALTGMRRGRGAATRVDAEFAARHRPWDDPDRWEVDIRLSLDDGRTIDISQDLAGKVACRAVEVGLGRDVSHEILDGTPDASRWLGLDRDAFAATVCVNQAQVVSVAESAAMLQEHMQRAAATRGTDATAAEAIERLTAFRREKVGLDRENARGPLRLARNRLALVRDELDAARRQRAEYLQLVSRLEVAEQAASEADGRLKVAEAAIAAREAAGARRTADRARDLSARHPTAPPSSSERDATADLVAAALAGWAGRPAPVDLFGATAEELEGELAKLPVAPDGDLEPHPEVVEARRALERATDALELVASARDAAGGDSSADRSPHPAGLHRAQAAGVGVAGALLFAGASLLVVGASLPGALLSAAAFAVAAWTAAGWLADRRRARHTLRADAGALESRRSELESRVALAAERLVAALESRGAVGDSDPLQSAREYEAECRSRAAQAAIASRAEPLRKAIGSRRAAEAAAAGALAGISAAGGALVHAAGAAGLPTQGRSADDLVEALGAWQDERAELARLADEARSEWQELQTLLAGSSVEALEGQAAQLTATSSRLAAALGATPSTLPQGDLERLRDTFRERHAAARREADELAGGLEMLSRRLPSVAEAEEAVAAATAEWERVMGLAATLDQTLSLLNAAQERVHRDLAPVLAAAVGRWLPTVCAGRYADVAVDPANLAVTVKEAQSGRWREARLLSEGTREQVYLLLRVAMAQHLVTTSETAPLLLDEVTAQSDPERKVHLLDVLHVLSAERQVILFSHDDDVAAWAEGALRGPEDRLVRLSAPAGSEVETTPVAVSAA